jgi:2-dehydro-3-deoxyglucarate aldolase
MNPNFYKKILKIKNKIKSGNLSIGSWLQLGDANVAEIMSQSNFDWLVADLEHGNFCKKNLVEVFRSISSGNSVPLARIKNKSFSEIQDALDMGSGGIIFPNINNSIELKELILQSSWPPAGKRGVGFSRANGYGKFFYEYKSFAQKPIIIGMIESKLALDNIESITKVKGLDALLIGPYDLSASLNITGKFQSIIFKNAIKKIIKICKKNKMSIGIHQVKPSQEELRDVIKKGFTFIPYGIDTTFIQSSINFKKQF